MENTVEMASKQGFTSAPAVHFFLERYEAAYRSEMAHFVHAVQTGTQPSPGIQDGLRAQLLADAAAGSLMSGLPVSVD